MRYLILLALGLAPLPLLADEWQRCAQLAEATPRLACYDALAARLRQAAPAASSAPKAPAPAPSAAQKIEAFGAPAVAQRDQLESIESRIDGVVRGWEPGTVFTLANGQRWAVADGSSVALYLRDPLVRIRRGAMGTFRIEFEGSNQTARVQRR